MKKMSKKLAAALSLAIGIGIAGTALAQPTFTPAQTTTTMLVIQETQGASINWENPSGADVQSMGIGIAPPNATSPAHGRALARRAAIVDAQRNLVSEIEGVQINAETTTKDMMVASDVITARVNAKIKGAKIISEGANPDGSYFVIMSVPLNGVSGIAGAVMPFAPPPADANVFTPLPAPAAAVAPTVSAHTGVVIDASGLGLKPTFSPAIYDTNGRGIYGTANVSSQIAIEKGMVGYSKDINSAVVNSRAGQNPLVIRATDVRGAAGGIGNKVNVVVTPEEGDMILAENAKSGILNNCAVVFIR